MSARFSWSQLLSCWTWFSWQSGELSSEPGLAMRSAHVDHVGFKPSWGWFWLWGGGCLGVGLPMQAVLNLATPQSFSLLFFNSTCFGSACTCFSCVAQSDSDWTSTQFIICSHVTESHFVWQRRLSPSTQHECADPIDSSRSLWVV